MRCVSLMKGFDGDQFDASLTSPLPGEIDCFVELVDVMALSFCFPQSDGGVGGGNKAPPHFKFQVLSKSGIAASS